MSIYGGTPMGGFPSIRGLLTPDERQAAMYQSLLNVGPLLMAAGAPSLRPGASAQALQGIGPAWQQGQDTAIGQKVQGLQVQDLLRNQSRQQEMDDMVRGLITHAMSLQEQAYARLFPEQYLGSMFAPGEPFTLGENQVRYGPNGEIIAEGPAGVPDAPTIKDFYEGGQIVQKQWDGTDWVTVGSGPRWSPTEADTGPDLKEIFGNEDKLRDEWNTQNKDFIKVRDAFRKVEAAYGQNVGQPSGEGSAAADHALIFAYMKTVDPGSTVREGEFATVEMSRGVPETVVTWFNRTLSGEKLTPEQRADFYNVALQNYQTSLSAYDQLRSSYSSVAQGYGLNADQILIDHRYEPQALGTSPSGGTVESPFVPPSGGPTDLSSNPFSGGDVLPKPANQLTAADVMLLDKNQLQALQSQMSLLAADVREAAADRWDQLYGE